MNRPAIKRVYDPVAPDDGERVLVDRLWPRGVARDRIATWLKDIAPSDALRRRFHGAPAAWEAFREAYAAELAAPAAQAAVDWLLERIARGKVTLLYAARDPDRNNAVALAAWLERQAPRRG